MTKQELADLLDGREYGNEITKEEAKAAKDAGLLVIFGYSDDCAEFEGLFSDEASCHDGGLIYFNKNGLMDIGDDDEEVLEKYGVLDQIKSEMVSVDAVWGSCPGGWTYKTALPHALFDILEDGDMDGDRYCRGIVIDVKDIDAATKGAA